MWLARSRKHKGVQLEVADQHEGYGAATGLLDSDPDDVIEIVEPGGRVHATVRRGVW